MENTQQDKQDNGEHKSGFTTDARKVLNGASRVLPEKNLAVIERELSSIEDRLKTTQKAAFSRFPLLFTLLGTFGFVATLYGFELLINRTFLAERPFVLLLIGVVILVFTGLLYKKL